MSALMCEELLLGWRVTSSRPGGMEDCCLVVPTYCRPAAVHQLVQHLATLPDHPAEVVIVDGSPVKDACSTLLRRWADSQDLAFDLVYVSSPPGTARQRNAGIDISTRDYVYFLDDDCLPEPGYFGHLRHTFDEDPPGRVGGVCGTLRNSLNKPLSTRWKARLWLRLIPRGEPASYLPCGMVLPRSCLPPFTGARPVDALPGGACVFRRAVFEQDRFSDFFQRNYRGEDLELSLRIRQSWQMLWCGDAYVLHYHAASGRPSSFFMGTMTIVNRYFIWRRHSPDAEPIDRLRFWLEAAFTISLDFAGFCRRPWSWSRLAHAAGEFWGVLHCLFRPPRYEEPPARRKYALQCANEYQGHR